MPVLTEATLRHARDDCPVTPDDPRQVHADFLVGAPARPPARARRAEGDGPGTGRGIAWLFTPGGFGRSKLAQRLEAVEGCPLIARNLRAVTRLVEMLDGRGRSRYGRRMTTQATLIRICCITC
ncbi:conserved hypothetical protein, putative [Citreicella sp. SE45]|nr:conserved hypothetical protein, putative [Citreicella sp. SE45]